jgi:hypothetical protein
VIFDTKGNIFGGFTPVKWKSTYCNKADDSQKSLRFALKIGTGRQSEECSFNDEGSAQSPDDLICGEGGRETPGSFLCNSKRSPCFSGVGVSGACNAIT